MASASNQINELLYQALETEIGGVAVYTSAVECAVNPDLKREWQHYLEQTERHVDVLRDVLGKLGLDPEAETPGRPVVRHLGESLVMAMALARKSGGPPEAAEIVAAECVVLAETKDHMNWHLIGQLGRELDHEAAEVLKAAYEEIEDQEDEHYYHTKGWARELWIQSLGLPAVLPPPEEVKKVETAIGAAKAEASRDLMAKKPAAKH
jgi:hypothetical protein